MRTLASTLKQGPILFDGAMGTMQLALGLPQEDCPEALNLTHSESIERIHRTFVEAGCQVVTTNTCGANGIKMAIHHHDEELETIVTRAVELAQSAAQGKALVALSLGPTGDFLQPYGTLTPDRLHAAFLRPLRAGQAAGADFAMLETQCDLAEARAAMLAAKSLDFPFVVSYTFEPTGRTLMGNPPEACATLAEALGATAVGINCSCGPEELLPIVRAMRAATCLPLIVQPNAGMPELREGVTRYPYTPQLMAEKMIPFVEMGLDGLGGCCGTTPEHLALIAPLVPQLTPIHPQQPRRLCNRRSVSSLDEALADADSVRLPNGMDVEAGVDEVLMADTGKSALLLDTGNWDAAPLTLLLQEIGDLDPRPMLFEVHSAGQAEAVLRAYQGVAAITPVGCSIPLSPILQYGAVMF